MKTKSMMVAMLLALACGSPLLAQSVYVVRIQGYDKEVTHEVMNREELTKLKQQVQAEGRVFQRALAAAKKEWEENEANARTRFPSGLSPRMVQEQGPLNAEQAKKKVMALEQRSFDADLKQAEKMKKAKADEREKMARRNERAAARDLALGNAAVLVDTHIKKLLNAAAEEKK